MKTARIAGKPVSPCCTTAWGESPSATVRKAAGRGNQQPSPPAKATGRFTDYARGTDRKSTRLNSSRYLHTALPSYSVGRKPGRDGAKSSRQGKSAADPACESDGKVHRLCTWH